MVVYAVFGLVHSYDGTLTISNQLLHFVFFIFVRSNPVIIDDILSTAMIVPRGCEFCGAYSQLHISLSKFSYTYKRSKSRIPAILVSSIFFPYLSLNQLNTALFERRCFDFGIERKWFKEILSIMDA